MPVSVVRQGFFSQASLSSVDSDEARNLALRVQRKIKIRVITENVLTVIKHKNTYYLQKKQHNPLLFIKFHYF